MLKVYCLLSVIYVGVTALENHFGSPCQLCDCFIYYNDRDVSINQLPYKVINNSYSVTEDNCLAGCLKDKECKTAVYGYVGGRSVFTCEYYDKVDSNQPIYAPFTNIYLKRTAECKRPYFHYKALEGGQDDKEVSARKRRFLKVHERLNPFNIGRR